MDPKGSNLASTDLLEISQLVSGSYVTKSITGAQIAASAPATAWGTITGTLSSQTDLNTALSGKVPTTRTLTINGTTQDLSADRTFTISTGITIGTTAITSGTNGRFLFDDAGVVSETNGAFWDKVNGRWGVGTITPAYKLDVVGDARISDNVFLTNGIIANITGTTRLQGSTNYFTHNRLGSSGALGFQIAQTGILSSFWRWTDATNDVEFGNARNASLSLFTNNTVKATITGGGNVLINTTTDAGFKLDVNGTERVTGGSNIQTLTVGLGAGAIATNTALGFRVLEANTTGGSNTGVGYIALFKTTTGSSNVALGSNVLQANITGSNNVGVGFNALKLATVNHNVGVGTEVLSATTTGAMNTALGNYALYLNTTGGNNVGLGYGTNSGNFSGSVIIGKDATATANNQFVIGSTGTNAGSVTSEVNASTQVWNVIINGVARKILLA
jgi:hypothetical protein